MRSHGRSESGTTIVEVAVGLAVGAVLVAGVLILLQQAQKSYLHTSEATDLQQNVRVGMDRVTRVIQAAGVNPQNLPFAGATTNDPAFTAFRQAGRNCLRVYADLNGDGDLNVGADPDETDEDVFFFWSTVSPSPLFEQRGALGGPDAGQAFVANGVGQPGTGPRRHHESISPSRPEQYGHVPVLHGINDPGGAQHGAGDARPVADGVQQHERRTSAADRPGGDHPDGSRVRGQPRHVS